MTVPFIHRASGNIHLPLAFLNKDFETYAHLFLQVKRRRISWHKLPLDIHLKYYTTPDNVDTGEGSILWTERVLTISAAPPNYQTLVIFIGEQTSSTSVEPKT